MTDFTLGDWILFLAKRNLIVSREIERIEAHLGMETSQEFKTFTASKHLEDLQSKEREQGQEGFSE